MPLKILEIDSVPCGYYPYLNAGPKSDVWGKQAVLQQQLPIQRVLTAGLPDTLEAVVITSDLQGLVMEQDSSRLLGEALPEFLAMLLEIDLGIDPAKAGVVLAGDFYATLDSRGGLDDIRSVWYAFREHFRWVAGVSGNHDDIGQHLDAVPEFKREKGIYYLDNRSVAVDGLSIGGLSGVVGENGKHNRFPETTYSSMLKKRLLERPDLMVTHQNPYHEITPFKGGQCVSEAMQQAPGQLLVCGHAIWENPLVELSNGAKVLNAGERVLVLCRS